MTNTALVPFGKSAAISITTTTGESLSIGAANSGAAPGSSVVDYIGGKGGEPLPRLVVVQPKDARGLPVALQGQFVITKKETATNERGEPERITRNSAGLGNTLLARVVGYTLNRSYMPKFDPKASNDNNKPLCHSENFTMPDIQYAGKYSNHCCALDQQRNQMVAVCPMAQWGAKDPKTGKGAPPSCNETYVLCLAIPSPTDGEWVFAEAYFKSTAARSGKTIIQNLRSLEVAGLPLYMYPVELTVTDAGVGYSFTGRLIPPPASAPETGTPTTDDIPVLDEGVQRWAEALAYRAERAARVEAPAGEAGSIADLAFGGAFKGVESAAEADAILSDLEADAEKEKQRFLASKQPAVAPTAPAVAATKKPKAGPMI